MKKFTIAFYMLFVSLFSFSQNAWINEIHYDNAGTDQDEMIEVVIEDAGSYTLSLFQVDLYNGNGGGVYDTKTLDQFTVGVTSNNFTIYHYPYPTNGIQNGAPDGMALSYNGTLISGQFLSYEGTLVATDGPANGQTSVDIGVSESSSTPIGESLQLTGNGTSYSDFIWTGPVTATAGNLNSGQSFGGTPDPEPSNYPTNFTASANGVSITLNWTDATGAQLPSAYLIKASDQDNIVPPVDGTPEADELDLTDGTGAKNVLFGDETYTFLGLDPNTTYYFAIYPYTNSGSNIDYKTDGTAPSSNSTTSTVILYEGFDLSWGAWDTISVLGAEVWDRDNSFGINGTPCAQMNGYSGGAQDNEDWLVSPPMNLDDYTNEVLTFYNAVNYSGPDLEALISTDYDGGGDPGTATWTSLSFTMSPGSWAWTLSGNIDLSSYNGTAVYIAFKYTSSTSAGAANWEIDEVLVTGDGAGPPAIVINEIMYNSPGNDEEWIELYNNSGSAVDISGWYIQDNSTTSTPLTLPGGTSLGADQYFTIAIATDGNFPFTPDFDGTDLINWALNNGGDEVNLYNLGGILVDHVAYDDEDPWPTAPDGGGPTLALIDPAFDNSLAESWDASEQDGGTPGAINFPPDPTPIVLTPNGGESWERGTTHTITWENFAGYTGNIYIELVDYSVTPPDAQLIVYNLPSANQSFEWTILPNQATGTEYRIRIADLSGTPYDESDTTFTITEMFVAPEIVITEIMYNPPEAGNDSLEFIELYNNGNEPVDMEGFYFTEGIDYTFPALTLNPSEYYVVCIDSVAFHNTFGMAAAEWDGGALSNSGEDIILVNQDGQLVDSVLYDDALPWDTLADGFGPSLTLCNPSLDNSLPESWSASTEFAAVNAINDSIFATPFAGCAFFLPVPLFEAEDTTIGVGFTALFEDMSLGDITAWEWTFEGGDPATSSQQDPPAVLYDTPGAYDVTLTVTNANGDSTLVKEDYISVDFAPEADFEADATFILAGYSTTFSDLSTGNPLTWEWSFEGGTPASYNQQTPPEIFYNDPGVYDVTLTVSNDYGESTLTREDYIEAVLNSIAELEQGSIKVYPNPARGEVTLRSSNLSGSRIAIYSLLGNIVYHGTIDQGIMTLDLSNQQKGLYFLRITTEDGKVYTQKLIIE